MVAGRLSWLALVVAACGGGGGEDQIEYTGTPGQPVAAELPGWVPVIQARLDGSEEHPFLVDTGAPLTIVDAVSFPEHGMGRTKDDIDAFNLSFPNYDTATWNVFGGGLGGILGGDLLRHFAFSIDYHGARVWLSDPYDPTTEPMDVDVGPRTDVSIEVAGGGLSLLPCGGCGTVQLPATRVLLKAKIEGQPETVWALVDSGASAIVFEESLFDQLGDPARPRLDGVDVGTVMGTVDGFLSRIWRIRIEGVDGGAAETVDDVPILVIPGTTLLAGLSSEVDRDVRVLIGGTVMREFLTTFDYQQGVLRLARYTDRSHIPVNEWIALGFNLDRFGDEYIITDVFDGTDAAGEGLTAGDVVEELAGTAITGQTEDFVNDLITGYSLGQEVPVGIRGVAGIEQHMVLVEDLLPSYPPPP